MAKKPTISTLVGGFVSAGRLNNIFQQILSAFDNTISRDGSTPNQMEADLDLNNNNLLNVRGLDVETLEIDGIDVVSLAAVPSWKGAWTTSTVYVANDIVRNEGSSYICLVGHTSGTFSVDLGTNYWELMAQRGAAGAGTGDMVASNNLGDVADVGTARANLGLTDTATATSTAFGKSLIDDADGVAARATLGLGTAALMTDSASSDLSSTPEGAARRGLVKDYVDSVTGWELFETAYNFSVDGVVSSVVANGWEDGYDYAVITQNITFSTLTFPEVAFEFNGISNTSWSDIGYTATSNANSKHSFYAEIPFARVARNVFGVRYIAHRDTDGTYTNTILNTTGSGNYLGITRSSGQKMSGILFRGNTGNINGGTVLVYRRKNQL